MSTSENFPLISLRGTAAEIGYQHGKLLTDRIEKAWRFYRGLVAKHSDSSIRAIADKARSVIQQFNPDYCTEIEAIAEGAGMPAWQIYTLNARTELLRKLVKPDTSECTALYLRKNRIIGENWDWSGEIGKLSVLLHMERLDGHRILMLTEPGIIGKIGLNSAGVGLCLTILYNEQGELDGVPIHILLRSVLDSKSVADAKARLQTAKSGTVSHLLVADDSGAGMNVEVSGRTMAFFDESTDRLAHTNHYLNIPIEDRREDFKNSSARFQRARELLDSEHPETVEDMKRILDDRSNQEYPICQELKPDYLVGSVGTIASIIMDLPARTMHVAARNAPSTNYTTHSV